MKILHIIAAYKPAVIYGGPTMSVAMLCEELNKAGLDISVFTTTANGAAELQVTTNTPTLIDGVEVTYFKRFTKDHTHFSPGLLKALWRVKDADAVHIHAWWNLVSVFSCIIALAKGVPVVLSPRGTLSNYTFSNKNTGKKSFIHGLLGKRLLAKCHVLATSEQEAKSVSSLLTPRSVTILPNFVTLDDIRIEHTPPLHQFKLLFFSRIEEKKGLEILLAALKLVLVPYHLTIAGNGDENYMAKLKASVTDEVKQHVTWAGFYTNDKFNLLREHHLLILPSYDENFGNVVIESLSVGTAVLVSENVGLAPYIEKNQLGWICKTTLESVANQINHIYSDMQYQLDTIREFAPGLVRKDFTGEGLAQQYISFYKNLN